MTFDGLDHAISPLVLELGNHPGKVLKTAEHSAHRKKVAEVCLISPRMQTARLPIHSRVTADTGTDELHDVASGRAPAGRAPIEYKEPVVAHPHVAVTEAGVHERRRPARVE